MALLPPEMQAGKKPREAAWVIWEGAGEINVPCVPHKELQPREGNGQAQGGTAGGGKEAWGRAWQGDPLFFELY